MGTARYALAGSGLQTAALAFGGNPGGKADTEQYDGTNWTTTSDLATGRRGLGSGNSSPSTASLAFGGNDGSATNVTEEYTFAVSLKTISDS